MKLIITLVVVAVAGAGVVAWWFWRRRKKRADALISLVALLREPVTFDPAVLAKMASRAWNADLGDGTAEGPDGFVVGAGSMNMVKLGERLFLVNCFPTPYVPDPQAVAAEIPDLRLRGAYAEHQAWFSIDAMAGDRAMVGAEKSAWYRLLAKLMAEFLDENCLLVFIPDTRHLYATNEDTARALQSDDPLAALAATRTLPFVAVPTDNPRMQQAVAEAKNTWPRFIAAFEAEDGQNFSVKAPVSYGENTEFIWIQVTAVEGEQVYGLLGNDPNKLGPLKYGSKVCVPLADLNDWCYVDQEGNLQGGFTVAAMTDIMREQEKS